MARELKKAQDKLTYAYAYIKELNQSDEEQDEEYWILQKTIEEALFLTRSLRARNHRDNGNNKEE